MIRHVALFRFNEDTTEAMIDHIDATLSTLPNLVAEIVTFQCGRNSGITDTSWDYGVVADFLSAEDYNTYALHPGHIAIVKNVIAPHLVDVARAQFQVHDVPA